MASIVTEPTMSQGTRGAARPMQRPIRRKTCAASTTLHERRARGNQLSSVRGTSRSGASLLQHAMMAYERSDSATPALALKAMPSACGEMTEEGEEGVVEPPPELLLLLLPPPHDPGESHGKCAALVITMAGYDACCVVTQTPLVGMLEKVASGLVQSAYLYTVTVALAPVAVTTDG